MSRKLRSPLIFACSDVNKVGHIDYAEFVEWLYTAAPNVINEMVGFIPVTVARLNGESIMNQQIMPGVQDVSAGGHHTIFLKQDGTALCDWDESLRTAGR